MICTEPGAALSTFLDLVTLSSERFGEVVFCAPFIDRDTAQRLGALIIKAGNTRCGVTIITTLRGRNSLSQVLKLTDKPGIVKIRVRPDLHAKVYLALGRGYRGYSEAIITSANLTSAAFSRNLEFGVHATSRSSSGRALIAQTRYVLSRLSNNA